MGGLLLDTPWKVIAVLGLLLFPALPGHAEPLGITEWPRQEIGTGYGLPSDNKQPSLFTEDFGDCMVNSVVKLTQFSAAYYKDNSTVVVHLDGRTSLVNESLMMYMTFFAYGKRRFDLVLDPCKLSVHSLCPMDSSKRITGDIAIQIEPTDISEIPLAALRIPDFEGLASLQFFSNSTQTQIACYASTVTNGVTLSHPDTVGSILGLLISVTFVLSLASIIYGEHTTTMRIHYSHSPSLLVAFTVLRHIYLVGALSANWPRVLVAYWSNFAPFAGMIYSQTMQDSINRMTGQNSGDISIFGSSSAGITPPGLAFYNTTSIFNSLPPPKVHHSSLLDNGSWRRAIEENFHAVAASAPSYQDTFRWSGYLIDHGLPLPGNYSGFPGTLSMQRIPARNALATALLWFIILLVSLTSVIPIIKLITELLIYWKVIKGRQVQNLVYFRMHWLELIAAMLLRALLIGFGMLIFFTLFQFRLGGTSSSKALAAITFLVLLAGSVFITGSVISYRNTHFTVIPENDPLVFEKTRLLKIIPWFVLTRKGGIASKEAPTTPLPVYPWWKTCIHDPNSDESKYLLRFGWLTARFKDNRWHFFLVWSAYEFLRACCLGGAAANPDAQIFSMLILEILFTACLVAAKPFEARRLSVITYALAFNNISSTALSIPLQTQYNIDRMAAFAIGMVIIVIQSILVALLMALMLAGVVTTYISITRRREIPDGLRSSHPIRMKYLENIDREINSELQPPPFTLPRQVPVSPSTTSGFTVHSVHRYPKIRDESPTRYPSTPTSSWQLVDLRSTPSLPELNPFSSSSATSIKSGFYGSESSDPFNATTAIDSAPSGFDLRYSSEQYGLYNESSKYKLSRMRSIETVMSRSTNERERSQDDNLYLIDTFETAKSDFDALSEYLTPAETNEKQNSPSTKP